MMVRPDLSEDPSTVCLEATSHSSPNLNPNPNPLLDLTITGLVSFRSELIAARRDGSFVKLLTTPLVPHEPLVWSAPLVVMIVTADENDTCKDTPLIPPTPLTLSPLLNLSPRFVVTQSNCMYLVPEADPTVLYRCRLDADDYHFQPLVWSPPTTLNVTPPSMGSVIENLVSHNGHLYLMSQGAVYQMEDTSLVFECLDQLEVVPDMVTALISFTSSAASSASASASTFPLVSHRGPDCLLHEVLPSPVLTQDRNKCAFTIGYDATGGPRVGYRLGSFLAGTLAIGDPSSAPNIPTPIIQLCEAMQHLVVASVLKPYDLVAHAGFWRVLTCRYSARTDSLLVLLQINRDCGATEDVMESELTRVVTALTTQFATTLKGIHVCNYQGLSVPPQNHPITVLWGAETLKDFSSPFPRDHGTGYLL